MIASFMSSQTYGDLKFTIGTMLFVLLVISVFLLLVALLIASVRAVERYIYGYHIKKGLLDNGYKLDDSVVVDGLKKTVTISGELCGIQLTVRRIGTKWTLSINRSDVTPEAFEQLQENLGSFEEVVLNELATAMSST